MTAWTRASGASLGDAGAWGRLGMAPTQGHTAAPVQRGGPHLAAAAAKANAASPYAQSPVAMVGANVLLLRCYLRECWQSHGHSHGDALGHPHGRGLTGE